MKSIFEIPHCETCLPRLHSMFGALSQDELSKLQMHKGCNFHRSGKVLFYEGDYPSGLYCINRGKVKLTKVGEAGREQIVRLAREGDTVGYRALVSGTPYELSATVIEDASVCFIPRQTFHQLMTDNSADHIAIPIEMPKKHYGEEAPAAVEWEQVNNGTALWMRPRTELKEEDYNAFYKHIAHDFEDPLAYAHNRVEGTNEYSSLLFIPKRAPFDLWDRQPNGTG